MSTIVCHTWPSNWSADIADQSLKPFREEVTMRQLWGLLALFKNTNDSLISVYTFSHYTPVLTARVQNLLMDPDEIN